MQIGAQLRVRRHADRSTAPETIARAYDRRSQQIASAIRLGPLKGEVEFQDQRPQRLQSAFWLV